MKNSNYNKLVAKGLGELKGTVYGEAVPVKKIRK